MVDALSQLLWLSTIRIPTFCTITFKTDFNWSRWFRKLRFFSSKIMKWFMAQQNHFWIQISENYLDVNVRQIWNDFFKPTVFPKKWLNKFDFPACRFDFVHFSEESEDPKSHFEINWPLALHIIWVSLSNKAE